MIQRLVTHIQWLEPGEEVPQDLNWIRTNVEPVVGERRFLLSSCGLKEKAKPDLWVMFQPGLSSVNCSYCDYPEEIKNTYLCRIDILREFQSESKKSNLDSSCCHELDTWYECSILDTIRVLDLPFLEEEKIFKFPEYEHPEEFQFFEFDHFINIYWSSQGYLGKESLILKHNDDLVLVVHEEWYGDDQTAFGMNYKLSEKEKTKVLSFRKGAA